LSCSRSFPVVVEPFSELTHFVSQYLRQIATASSEHLPGHSRTDLKKSLFHNARNAHNNRHTGTSRLCCAATPGLGRCHCSRRRTSASPDSSSLSRRPWPSPSPPHLRHPSLVDRPSRPTAPLSSGSTPSPLGIPLLRRPLPRLSSSSASLVPRQW
jgi:hypothetical protein